MEMTMGKTQIIIVGILFFSLAATAFLLTLIEFVNMDKNPDKYKNPRYKKEEIGCKDPKATTKKKTPSVKKTTISSTVKKVNKSIFNKKSNR